MTTEHPKNRQVVLLILDGWGMREEKEYNAIAEAHTPFFDSLWRSKPHTLLEASGLAVGLPEGVMGNSEVGHTTIGAGRTSDTDLVRISKTVRENRLGEIADIQKLFAHVRKHDSTCHFFGLIGPGSVHSHSEHLYGLLRAAKDAGITKVAIHAFADGRDTPPQSGASYLKELEEVMSEIGLGCIATVSGRYYAMDRDNNWDRIEKVERAIFSGEGKRVQGKKASEVVQEAYERKEVEIDEHIQPIVFLDEDGKSFTVQPNDGALFFNYRVDRSRQMSRKIYERSQAMNIFFVAMTNYNDALKLNVAFPPQVIETNVSEQLSKAGLTQTHIAETEKFAHVTYYFNSGYQVPYEGEEDIIIDSRKDVRTHDEAPEMRAIEVANKAVEHIKKGRDFIVLNLANADMVGHTANREAIIRAIETVDTECTRIVETARERNAVVLITADHGNAEIYFDPVTGTKHTAHTTNKVPFIVCGVPFATLREGGSLADIAPTILELFGIPKPASMTGKSILNAM